MSHTERPASPVSDGGYEEPGRAPAADRSEKREMEESYPPPESMLAETESQDHDAERSLPTIITSPPAPSSSYLPSHSSAASASSVSLSTSSHGSPQTGSSHARTASYAPSIATSNGRMSLSGQGTGGPQLSIALIIPGLTTIAESKEAKRTPELEKAAKRAIELCHSNEAYGHPREIFHPLQLACETKQEKLVVSSLDLISKLVSHSFFNEFEGSAPGQPPLADLLAHTITMTYSESSPPAVALQVVKALLALVLSPSIMIHQSSLLKAVRTVYNVFLLSSEATNQMVAQGGLTQMVHHVFGRILSTPAPFHRSASGSLRSARMTPDHGERKAYSSENLARRQEAGDASGASEAGDNEQAAQDEDDVQGGAAGPSRNENHQMTLCVESFNAPNPMDRIPARSAGQDASVLPDDSMPIAVPQGESMVHEMNGNGDGEGSVYGEERVLTIRELFIKDAFLVFRALCKLTMKPLLTESERDLRSHDMRSKLLSLHLVAVILKSHSGVFADPSIVIPSSSSYDYTPFLQATKQYLCLCLSRNALSPVVQVYDLSIEIFWSVLHTLRSHMKKEIEVLFNEIFIPILEMRPATLRQKSALLGIYQRLCDDPQALVDIYINYDCDRNSQENTYERLISIIAKIGQIQFAPPAKAELAAEQGKGGEKAGTAALHSLGFPTEIPELSKFVGLSPEQRLKRQSLECVVAVLRSLSAWASPAVRTGPQEELPRQSEERSRTETALESADPRLSFSRPSGTSTPEIIPGMDDVERIEAAKQQKTSMMEGIKRFNFKPKRGIEYLIDQGFIRSNKPSDIARFLLSAEGLNKAAIGEYLGEADDANVATLHSFVDMLDFSELPFTEAVRLYLQSFRLPGEAQKIDRFMLKFAERYTANNTTTEFANADTAYILAFSVILLNTDAHNKNLKSKRMSKAEFIRNNRGINDGKDLPEDFLSNIWEEIQHNEIKMKDEVEAVGPAAAAGTGLASTLANVGRDLQREAFIVQSEGMANKSEALFKTLVRHQRRGAKSVDLFYSASHLEHVKPMFALAWMPFLAAISGPLQETEDMSVVLLCLEGFKHSIKIAGLFDMELERNAYVSTLAKFTFLGNLSEMKPKNVEAIKTLLDIAISDGNNLKSSWKEVLVSVSQLERMQLISSGVDVPELHRRDPGKKAGQPRRRGPAEDVAEEGRSTQVTVAADMVFSLSKNLSGTAIVDFVTALSQVSWEEIQSSSNTPQPRLFSLQKLVDISYYNMGRIRLEWSGMWAVLGNHFNQVCCHNNPHVSFFALDALRQLAMRFLEKEELSNFRFQKDFLRPFEHAMSNNTNADAREMILQCMQQMVQARVHNLRSGWQTMFKVFSAASLVLTERVVSHAFELVNLIYREHFALVIQYGSFAELTSCITDFSRVRKYQKISLQAIDMLRGMISKMLESSEALQHRSSEDDPKMTAEDPMAKLWYPILFSFYDIIMTADDLEVRRLALDCLFDTLKTHGSGFRLEFWDSICTRVLFPIFSVLKTGPSASRIASQEDMSVWLSTTMISALRNLISLYTFYFETLQEFLDGLLDLLCACICQENDTLARIGTACFQQLLEENVRKLSASKWERVVGAFVQLFKTTTAHQLFDPALRSEQEAPPDAGNQGMEVPSHIVAPAPLTPMGGNEGEPISMPMTGPVTAVERRRAFKQIIVKCVLQLLLIETTHELLQNDEVYNTIPAEHLLRFMTVLDDSYQFARRFNADKDIRMALWKVGFMKQLPNLLKQESSAAATLVNVLMRMYADPREEHIASRSGVLKQFVPLTTDIIRDFNAIDPETQPRNVTAWTPVVTEILNGCCAFEDESFAEYLPRLYPLVTEMLARDMSVELWQVVRSFYVKTGKVKGLMGPNEVKA